MDSSNCLSYKRLVILHKLRCANCVTKILYFFHTTKLSVPDFSNFIFFTRIFFFVPNYRIIEFLSSHGISRTVTGFFLVPNFRIFEFYLFVPRLVLCPETCPWTHWPQGGNYRIFVFRDSPWYSVWLKRNISGQERLFRDTQRFSVW